MQQFYAPPQDPFTAGTTSSFAGATLPGAHVTLYKPGQIALATFLGSALGGGILFAMNESRLGRKRAARNAILVSLLATAVVLGIAFALPANFPAMPLGIVTMLAASQIAKKRQQTLVDAHVAAGGKCASSWAAAGIGVASLFAVLIPVFVVAFAVTILKG